MSTSDMPFEAFTEQLQHDSQQWSAETPTVSVCNALGDQRQTDTDTAEQCH